MSTGSSTLQLVRSFDIPTDDPSYVRLLNWSWTYDSAITAAAFTVSGYASEAQQLLDQLAALQHTDGSIEIAFNVADGTAEPVFRSGTIATVGMAGSLYDQTFHSNRYLAMEQRAASYLLSLQGTDGLLRGGPELLVQNASTAYFIEGLNDNVQSLDADALGGPGQSRPVDRPKARRRCNWIAAVTPTDAPLQSDQTVTSPAYGEEYHVWPAAAAGAWMLLALHSAPLFG